MYEIKFKKPWALQTYSSTNTWKDQDLFITAWTHLDS